MDFLLLSLVLVSIFIGWILGRWQAFKKNTRTSHTKSHSESYAKGLNYLLSDDPDNAIKAFREIIETNPNMIEINLSLGNLFRSKGEVEHAIQVHQNLLARPDLNRKQRNTAIEELANDYLKAGLLDRAEKLFKEIADLKNNNLAVYQSLLDIYITGKSWSQAVDCAKILFDRRSEGAATILSQCYCEVAEQAMAKNNRKKAKDSLMMAIDVDENCVRAALLLIQWYLTVKNNAAAKKVFERLVKKNPEYMVLYIEPAKQIYLLGKESSAYQLFLQKQHQNQPSTPLVIALLEYYVKSNQAEKAHSLLSEVLIKTPSFEAYEFALQFLISSPTKLADTCQKLVIFLKKEQQKKLEFICTQCGYESHTIQWNCPSCRLWSSIKPV